MSANNIPGRLHEPIRTYLRKNFISLNQDIAAEEAIRIIRKESDSNTINYFYVTDEHLKLVGVLNTRILLTADASAKLNSLMIKNVETISDNTTILETCRRFYQLKLLALPAINEQGIIEGIADINIFSKELLDAAEQATVDDIFESIGFRISQLQHASLPGVLRLRLPWLFATITSGTVCALLASMFETTIMAFAFISFFLAMILALGESVSIQSMTVTIQNLNFIRPTRDWLFGALKKETLTALMLGLACGGLVGIFVFLWLWILKAALVIALTITLSFVTAAALGLTIPTLLHAYKLDLKIAAGPLTLALADMLTILFYFSLARILL